MNPADLFVFAKDLPEKKILGRIAINEENTPGILIKVKSIDKTKIYVGMDIAKGTEWVSLNPMVMTSGISLRTAMELYYVLRDIKRDELRAKLDVSISSPMSTDEVISDLGNATWSKFTFDDTMPPEAIQDFFSKLFGNQMGMNDESTSPYNDNDFKIDNEDEDPHNM